MPCAGMFRGLFHRGCALLSELEDALQLLHRWHRTWSAPSGHRALDMYALEDRVLFNIAPVVNAAAVQAAAAGTATAAVQDAQICAMPDANQSLVAVHHVQAGQETDKR